jgi:hypothetical protein
MAMLPFGSPQDYGSTTPNLQPSLMILASNTSTRLMLITAFLPFRTAIPSQKIGQAPASYLGLTLNWNYAAGYVDISMPSYVPKALSKFQHPAPISPQHAPHQWTKPVYGQKIQFANTDTSPLLNKKDTQRVQSVSGTFLYYA